MRLEKLVLQNFRNHRMCEFDFKNDSTVIIGSNTAGKTNILEAIYLLATGESFREGKVEAMVAWGEELGRVQGLVLQMPNDKLQITNKSQTQNSNSQRIDEIELEVMVTRGLVQGKRVAKRKYLVNGVSRQKNKLVGNLLVVSFRPEDLRVVEGSPSRRRKFMDEVLVQVDREYARSLMAYSKALARRNKLLDMIRDGKTQRTALAFWDGLVIKNGEYVQKKRRDYEHFLNTHPTNQEFGLEFEYDPSVISQKRMAEYADREILVGYQLVGPHRDDFLLKKQVTSDKLQDGKDLAIYGSRGEQRLGVLWLKMQAIEYVEEMAGVRPVLLLDDIFSELDHELREFVFSLFGKQQTIATTADSHYVEGFDGGMKKITI